MKRVFAPAFVLVALTVLAPRAQADPVIVGYDSGMPYNLPLDDDTRAGYIQAAAITVNGSTVTIDQPVFHTTDATPEHDYKLDATSDVTGLICALVKPDSRMTSQQTAGFLWGFWQESAYGVAIKDTGFGGTLTSTRTYLTQVVCTAN